MNDDHEELLGRLDDAYVEVADDPIPEALLSAARSAFAWRRADAALAEIVFDSDVDDLVGVRGSGSDRRAMHYQLDGVDLYVSLTEASITVMIDGHADVPIRIVTQLDDGVALRERTTDEFGEYIGAAPSLPVRIEVDLPGGTGVTPWIVG